MHLVITPEKAKRILGLLDQLAAESLKIRADTTLGRSSEAVQLRIAELQRQIITEAFPYLGLFIGGWLAFQDICVPLINLIVHNEPALEAFRSLVKLIEFNVERIRQVQQQQPQEQQQGQQQQEQQQQQQQQGQQQQQQQQPEQQRQRRVKEVTIHYHE